MAGGRRVKIPRKARKARSGKYKFSDKTHPIEGIVSFGMGILAAALTLAAIILSEKAGGQAGILAGILGTAALLIAAAGFVLSVLSFKRKEIHYRFPAMGGVINGALALFLLMLYMLGAAITL